MSSECFETRGPMVESEMSHISNDVRCVVDEHVNQVLWSLFKLCSTHLCFNLTCSSVDAPNSLEGTKETQVNLCLQCTRDTFSHLL